ncbi:unnamed protein product [Arctogadus glacialis]
MRAHHPNTLHTTPRANTIRTTVHPRTPPKPRTPPSDRPAEYSRLGQAGSSKLISEAVEEVVQLLISSKTPAPTVCMHTRPLNTMTRDDMEAVSHNVCVLPAPHPWLAD